MTPDTEVQQKLETEGPYKEVPFSLEKKEVFKFLKLSNFRIFFFLKKLRNSPSKRSSPGITKIRVVSSTFLDTLYKCSNESLSKGFLSASSYLKYNLI